MKLKKKHPILFFAILFFICWLPYVVIFYPGTMNMDSLKQINQYFGVIEWTTQHPIFPTIMYANFMKLGQFILNDNFGMFLNNIIQMIIAALSLSYGINYIYKITENKKVMYALFMFFAILPTWPIHFYSEVKDVWFSLSVLWFVIFSIKFIKSDGKLNKKEWFGYFFSMMFMYLFRNNGIYEILFILPFLLAIVKKKEKIKIASCSILVIIICMGFTKIFISTMSIQKGNFGVVLSLPLHQTAYYYNNYELTEEEASNISKVIELEDLKKYFNPESPDFLKSQYKNDTATKSDLKNYLTTWFKMFLKHPSIYFKATLNSTYGYIYPDRTEYKDGIAQYTIDASGTFDYVNVTNLDLHFNNLPNSEGLRNIIIRFVYMLRNMPFVGLLFSCGFYTWITIGITLIMIYFKKYKELIILVPLYTIILVSIASPVNSYVRYMLPVMLSLPFVVAWIINEIRKENVL